MIDVGHLPRWLADCRHMLLISVIVIAIVAAAYVFIEPFKQGVQDLGKDVKKILSDGKIGRVGATR